MQKEVSFKEYELIVSTTDKKGNILYANDIFCKVAGYKKDELINKPHNIIRHPDMPKAVFKLLWDRVLNNQTIYAFVKNKTKDGNYYWVKAFVSAILDENNQIKKLVSYRKKANSYAVKVVGKLFKQLVEYEKDHTVKESVEFLERYLDDRNLNYDQFVDRLSLDKNVTNAPAQRINYKNFYVDHVLFRTKILHAVEFGEDNITVTDPCCCSFGKWIETIKDESFTTHPSWQKVIEHHEHVHNSLKEYILLAKNSNNGAQKENLLNIIKSDTNKIFSTLQDVIDNCN